MATDTLDRRIFVWDLIDAHWPELWDQPAPLKATPQLIETIAAQVGEAHPVNGLLSPNPNVRSSARHQQRRLVRRWLNDPAKHSPYVDHVAVARAVGFDWDVIRSLTSLEWERMCAELAAHRDPYGDADTITGGPEGVISRSHRSIAWNGGTPNERLSIMRKVDRLRKERKEEAA